VQLIHALLVIPFRIDRDNFRKKLVARIPVLPEDSLRHRELWVFVVAFLQNGYGSSLQEGGTIGIVEGAVAAITVSGTA
jgi:hypothetical protein